MDLVFADHVWCHYQICAMPNTSERHLSVDDIPRLPLTRQYTCPSVWRQQIDKDVALEKIIITAMDPDKTKVNVQIAGRVLQYRKRNAP